MTTREVAARVDAHLKRFERDPKINPKSDRGLTVYWGAGSWSGGRWVYVQYVSYRGACALSKADAETYLRWLDAGNDGWHYEALARARGE